MLQVLVDEKLADNAQRQGEKLRARLGELQRDGSRVTAVRGKVLRVQTSTEETGAALPGAAELLLLHGGAQSQLAGVTRWRGCERAGLDECHRYRGARRRECLRCLHAPEGQRPAGEPWCRHTADIMLSECCVLLLLWIKLWIRWKIQESACCPQAKPTHGDIIRFVRVLHFDLAMHVVGCIGQACCLYEHSLPLRV